jgi:hypothetical protein
MTLSEGERVRLDFEHAKNAAIRAEQDAHKKLREAIDKGLVWENGDPFAPEGAIFAKAVHEGAVLIEDVLSGKTTVSEAEAEGEADAEADAAEAETLAKEQAEAAEAEAKAKAEEEAAKLEAEAKAKAEEEEAAAKAEAEKLAAEAEAELKKVDPDAAPAGADKKDAKS